MIKALRALAILAAVSCSFVQAQDWTWPEKPSNLQVFPKDWTGSRLSPVMKGFTRALGVRCSHCHKGVEGQPLSTYDFASDENPNKNRAREMLRMLKDINTHLKNIEPSGDQRVNMWCHTCHRGRPRPMTLEEELSEQYRKGGIKAALDHYADLKKDFYGRGAYDFGELTLIAFAEDLEEKDVPAAIEVLRLNSANFPQSLRPWTSLAEAYGKAGNSKEAAACYKKAMAVAPDEKTKAELQKQLDKLLQGTAK